ncbi:MAG: hypothetical protein KME08_14605 [Aphanothece sp. CMT-3BRIN-NPC111]|nr:hypothetical protein [Aphanothece sp. CMT-3BRIN-NPC111]
MNVSKKPLKLASFFRRESYSYFRATYLWLNGTGRLVKLYSPDTPIRVRSPPEPK